MMEERQIEKLREELAQTKEDLFIANTAIESMRTENISLKNFIQNLYESCEELENESELNLQQALNNLRENIRALCRQDYIRL